MKPSMLQEASDLQPATVDEKAEPFRAALDKSMQAYIKEHYPNGVVTVSTNLSICTSSWCVVFMYAMH